MIIKRKYEQIGILVEKDIASKEILMKALTSKYDEMEAERILKCDSDSFLYLADMSLCIPKYDEVMKILDELDDEKPYDNGLTYRDVTRVQLFPSRKGSAAELWMINLVPERISRIVQIIAIEYKDGVNTFIQSWGENYIVQ